MFPYPFSYFASIFQPRKIFANRQILTLWQRIFTTIFLISLLIIPASLQPLELTTYPMENFVEGVYSPLTDEVVADMKQYARIENGQFSYTGTTSYDQVTFGNSVSDTNDFSYQFAQNQLIIRKGSDILTELSYDSFATSSFDSKSNLTASISQGWFISNRLLISLSITLVSAVILATNFLFILLGASFFLFLTKKSRFFQIGSFKEAYNLSLNCLGLPTLIACLIGIFGQPVTTVLTVQNICFVLVLIWVFFKTRFRDE
ncbi:TPA: hypothetical protein ACGOON_001531 [Streptococcus suis]